MPDNLYDLGKRYERLLYLSVVIIVLGMLICSLSFSVIKNSVSNTAEIYHDFTSIINGNREALGWLHAEIIEYEKYSQLEVVNSKVTSNEKELASKNKIIDEQNKFRIKLGLPTLPRKELSVTGKKPVHDWKLSLNRINNIASEFGIPKYNNMDEAWNAYREILRGIAKELPGHNVKVYTSLLEFITTNEPPEVLVSKIESEILKIKESKVTILDVETPLNIPFSFGDLKSSISLYTIEEWAMVTMPILLIIWSGSLIVTRRFEARLIINEGDLKRAYPHILNVYYINNVEGEKKARENTINKAILGHEESIKELKSLNFSYFCVRVFIIMGVFMLMLAPVYYGFIMALFSFAFDKGIYYLMGITLSLIVNLFQLSEAVRSEWALSKFVFKNEGGIYELP